MKKIGSCAVRMNGIQHVGNATSKIENYKVTTTTTKCYLLDPLYCSNVSISS